MSLTTLRDGERDTTRVLIAGDHPFVQHDSVIRYRAARVFLTATLEGRQQRGMLKSEPPASHALLDQIREGALASDATSNEVKAEVRRCTWVPEPEA